ncbi:MAG: PTS system mannose/fructose/sorbose family transporter subunit IID [Elusimicrobiota bacterium]
MSIESDKNQIPDSGHVANNLPLATVFFRSFMIQAGWNYERLQNLGFAFAITPALRRIYASSEAFNAAVLRHLGLFNTQPYMVGFVLGNVIKMEEGLARSPGNTELEKKLIGVKQALSSGFASIGDRVFWGRLKPITTQLCIVVWFLAGFYGWLFTGHGYQPSALVLFGGPLAGIVIYGAFAVYLRWIGLKRGYACGGQANCGLDAMRWPGLIRLLSVAGFAFSLSIVLGAFGLLIAHNLPGESKGDLAMKLALVLCVMALQRVTRKFGRSIFFAMGIIVAVSVAVFTIFNPGKFNIYL